MRLLITWLWFNVAEILDFRRVCACYLYTLFMSFYLMFGIVRITLGLRHKFASQMVSTECCLSIKTKQIRNMIVHRIYVHVNLKNPLVWKSLNCRKKEERRVPHTHIYIVWFAHKNFFPHLLSLSSDVRLFMVNVECEHVCTENRSCRTYARIISTPFQRYRCKQYYYCIRRFHS